MKKEKKPPIRWIFNIINIFILIRFKQLNFISNLLIPSLRLEFSDFDKIMNDIQMIEQYIYYPYGLESFIKAINSKSTTKNKNKFSYKHPVTGV